jgi:hypothetical protein
MNDNGESKFSSPPQRLKQTPRRGVTPGGGAAGISDRRPRAVGAAQDAEQSNRRAEQLGIVPPVTLDPDRFVDGLEPTRAQTGRRRRHRGGESQLRRGGRAPVQAAMRRQKVAPIPLAASAPHMAAAMIGQFPVGAPVRKGEAPDLRNEPRQLVDKVWQRAADDCMERFGRRPSVDAWNQPSTLATVALANANRAEADYVTAARSPNATAATVDGAFDRYAEAVAGWLNAATEGWPSRAVYIERTKREQETW